MWRTLGVKDRYRKDGLHSPSDIVMGFDTNDLPCSQDLIQQFPSKNIMNYN